MTNETRQARINNLLVILQNAAHPISQLEGALLTAVVTPLPDQETDRLLAQLRVVGAENFLGLDFTTLRNVLTWNDGPPESTTPEAIAALISSALVSAGVVSKGDQATQVIEGLFKDAPIMAAIRAVICE